MAIIEMADYKEQKLCVKFCFMLGKLQPRPLGFFKEPLMARFGEITVLRMASPFKSGILSTEDMPLPGHPSMGRNDEDTVKIKRVIDGDCRKTID
ncbi:HTH_48 domain-containing protein [Trichonephila clavipes]|nr:HTH_48 domain-containing protein [Trichonephila clavipes]